MQQAIEEAKKLIEEINREKDGYYDTKEDRINLLNELIERLEAKVSLPQEELSEKNIVNIL